MYACLFLMCFFLSYFIGLYNVAFAIADAENESNWRWFLEKLAAALSNYPRRFTFISDRHNGLKNTLPDVFPGHPHGYCYRHLQSNLENKYPCGSRLKSRIPFLFMCCAYSRTVEYFEKNMALLRAEGGKIVEEFLEDLPPQQWCQAFFEGERFGELTNNLAESFNSWVNSLRTLPILDIVDGIRVKCMNSISKRKEEAKSMFSVLVPNMEKKLKDNLDIGRHWRVSRSDTNVYEVHCQKYSTMVNLESCYCSCGEWQVYSFPCSHVLAVIQQHGDSVYSLLSDYYLVDKYKEVYSFPVNPVPTISKSVHDFSKDVFVLKPPDTKRPPGRPRNSRYQKKNESRKRAVKCGRCHKYAGHNRKSCTAPI